MQKPFSIIRVVEVILSSGFRSMPLNSVGRGIKVLSVPPRPTLTSQILQEVRNQEIKAILYHLMRGLYIYIYFSCKKISKDRFKESQSINKSLFFLTRVIAMKTSRLPPQHIPYRNSTLTKIMKLVIYFECMKRSSISGNFRTLIILCITPNLDHFE